MSKDNVNFQSANPLIRFKGFADGWEMKKLGEVVKITMGQSPDGTTYSDTPSKYILVQGNADLEEGWVKPRIWTTQITKRADAGDLIMSVRAPAGAMGKTSYDVVIGRGVAGIKGNEFIFQLLSKMDSDSYWKKLSTGSTFESLNSDTIKNAQILLPNEEEQSKIGLLFSSIDNISNLLSKKIRYLQDFKNTLLSKMFPKNNELFPDIRFSGFTNPWEQRKLGEFGIFTSNGVDKIIRNDELPVNLLNYMDVYKKRKITSENCIELMQVTAKQSQILNNNVLKGDVFFTPTSETPEDIGHVLVIEENLLNTVYSYHLMRFRPNQNEFYLTFPNYCFETQPFRKQMTLKAKGVQRYVLSKSDFEDLVFNYTKYEEQAKIGNILTNIDNLLTLHQRKYDALRQIKKSLLSKMYI